MPRGWFVGCVANIFRFSIFQRIRFQGFAIIFFKLHHRQSFPQCWFAPACRRILHHDSAAEEANTETSFLINHSHEKLRNYSNINIQLSELWLISKLMEYELPPWVELSGSGMFGNQVLPARLTFAHVELFAKPLNVKRNNSNQNFWRSPGGHSVTRAQTVSTMKGANNDFSGIWSWKQHALLLSNSFAMKGFCV